MAVAHSFYNRRNNPEYLNWFAVNNALNILAGGLRKYVEKKMKEFHSVLMTKLGGIRCTCSCEVGIKPNPHSKPKLGHCQWAHELLNHHRTLCAKSIPWHQSDSNKWHDPVEGHWEITKIYMSDLRSRNWIHVKNIDCVDVSGVLNIMIFCTHINVKEKLLTAVKEWRNKIAHAPKLQFTKSDKEAALKDIISLIDDDEELQSSSEVQNCRADVAKMQLPDITIIREDELHIVEDHFMQFMQYGVENITNQMKEQAEQHEELMRELIETIHNEKEQVDRQCSANYSSIQPIWNMLVQIFLIMLSSKVMKKGSRYLLTVAMTVFLFRLVVTARLLFSHAEDNYETALQRGCPRCARISPISHFHFRKFNFSNHLTYMSEAFCGRKWLFDKLESMFKNDRPLTGILLTGEPGSGKSALMSQLICSPNSSLFIHNNIIGYHLCDHSEMGKRRGEWFVRNLVDQVAGSISEYADHVLSNEQLRRELDDGCGDDPIGCFHSTLVGPLRDLKMQPGSLRFIVIDALDECLEPDVKTSPILDIISSKMSYLPKWLKVLFTSRNLTTVTTGIPRTVKRVHLNPSDDRNMEDIRRYIHQFLFRNLFFIDRLSDAMRGISTAEKIRSLVVKLTDRGAGNFLVVKKTLEYMADSGGRLSLLSFPASLFDMYKAFFKRHFGDRDFLRFKPLFEVLLAAGSLHIDNISSIFELQNLTMDVTKLILEVSLFLRHGQDGTVKIYHLSFAEWLVSQASDADGFRVNKSVGHQLIADYLFHCTGERNGSLTLTELSELSMHVVSGGMINKHLQSIDYLNVREIWDSQNGRCILHNLAMNAGSFPILRIFLPKFATPDIPDNEGKTPAFYAASEGIVENLRILIEAGANVDYYTGKNDSLNSVSILVQNSGLEDAGLMYTAIINGHVEVVKLLLQKNISREQRWRNLPTPLQLAAAEGDVNMVKLLFDGGFKPDIVSLHHAAARNHSAVVSFLVKTAGVADKCVPCKLAKLLTFSPNLTVEEFHSSLRESALHSAVSRRHMEIVKFLLANGNDSLECIHHSGKTPLMDAVERNDSEIVELLLNAGANVDANCGDEMSSNGKDRMCSIAEKHSKGLLYTVYCETDYCPCGNKVLHLCARYGLWNMALGLREKWNAEGDKNCDGDSVFEIAVRFDQQEFIEQFYGDKPRSLVLPSYCSSVEILKQFGSDLDVLTSTSLSKKKLIDAFIFIVYWSPYPARKSFRSCSLVLKSDHRGPLEMKVNNESTKRIAALELFIQSQSNISCLLHEKNELGMTALHITAMLGFSDAVESLVQFGSEINAKDAEGRTALQLAVDASPLYPPVFLQCFSTFDGEFSACNTTSYDVTVSFLIWTQKFEIQICDAESASLLTRVIYKQMPLSLYTLLKVGVDANCRVAQPIRPLLFHLNYGGQQISEIFKMFEADVSVECGVSFRDSELHLMAYSSRLSDTGNFFKCSKNHKPFPLRTLIENHPDGHKIFDKCRDHEGFLAIHRAVQGGNIDAIKWFICLGVDIFRTTTSGLTPLDLSALYLEPIKVGLFVSLYEGVTSPLTATTYENRLQIFQILLEKHFLSAKEEHLLFQCSSDCQGLFQCHISSEKEKKIPELFNKKSCQILPNFYPDCENKPRILPRCCGKGNFLTVKKTLEYVADTFGMVNVKSFPASLYDVYKIFFKLCFYEQDFQRFKPLFEVLLAARSPLPIESVRLIFKLQNLTVDVTKLIQEASLLLRYQKNGAVKIFHLSFAEWLVRQTRDADGLPINMTIGHQYVADYLAHSIRERNGSVTLTELSELSMHVVSGGMTNKHLQSIDYFNVREIWDSQNGRCILHNLAMNAGSFPLLRIFLPKFTAPDIPDSEGKTPAFYAASEGIVENLRVLIEAGANVDYYTGKNASLLDSVSILVQNSGLEDAGLMYTAIANGHYEVVKLLLQNNISREQRWRNLPTPLQLAAAKGDVNIVKLLFDGGFKPDIISLHHAAARNHSAIVSFLVETAGVADKCIPFCRPAEFLTFSRNLTVEEFHSSLCESALHSAVSRRHIEIVRFLLANGNDSLECIHHSGKTPLMDAVERNDFEMVELLLNAGANVNAACGDEMSSDGKDLMCSISEKFSEGLLYTVYCETDYCPCGNKAVHLCARYGLWEMAFNLWEKWNAKEDRNCDSDSVFEIAVRFDQQEFIERLYVDITRSVELVSYCSSVEILKQFGSDLDVLTSSRMSKKELVDAFFFIVRWSPYPATKAFRSCSLVLKSDHRGPLEIKVNNESKKRTAALELFIQSQSNISSLLHEKNEHGKTALQVAAMFGFSDAVKSLVQFGSEINAKDAEGRTVLQLALDESPLYPPVFLQCFSIFDGEFSACNTTSYDVTVSHLIWTQRSEIQLCDAESASLLKMVIYKQMPLSLYTLLKVGVDANCRVAQSIRPLLLHLNYGGQQISEIFKMFEADVSVECGVFFRYSELHLMAYSSRLSATGNFFKCSKNHKPFPLKTAIKNHPEGHNVLDNCRDSEGFLAIHRAVQGGNIDAIKWFVQIGVDIFRTTTSGLTPLDLSALYLEPLKRETFRILGQSLNVMTTISLSATTSKHRRDIFEILLEKYLSSARKKHSLFQCNSNYEGLSPLHISAVRGGQILELFNKRNGEVLSSLPLDCENKHGILPGYIAYFYDSVEHAQKQVSTPISDFKRLGSASLSHFPDREAELYMIYDFFYETPAELLMLVYKQLLNIYPVEVSKCPGFYELLPNKRSLDDMVRLFKVSRADDKNEQKSGKHETENGGDYVVNEEALKRILAQSEEDESEGKNNAGAEFKGNKRSSRDRIDFIVSALDKHFYDYYCPRIMQHLQQWFTSRPRRNRHVSWFIAERMGWSDVSPDGDVRDRWPFYFLYRKVMRNYEGYEYLDVLSKAFEINDQYYYDKDDNIL